MKILFRALVLPLGLARGIQQQADIYYHATPVLGPSVWHFGPSGVSIFAPDGSPLRNLASAALCPAHWSSTGFSTDCRYSDALSDGHQYVYASSIAGDTSWQHHVQVFDLDTGDYAGFVDTCSTPLDLDYHPVREELYVRCVEEDARGGTPGEIDVVSAASLASNLPPIRLTAVNETDRPLGRMAVHSSMGPYGYSLAYDQNYVTEVDLSSKETTRYEIPDIHGGFETTYSPVNQHLYFRSRVCCTCGNETTDVLSCGSRGPSPVLVTTGPSQGPNPQPGVCSSRCEGSPADTVGVVEFDTVHKAYVDSHTLPQGFGATPVVSPDGRWVVLFGNDGGKNIRILRAGANGESSAFSAGDVVMNFEGGAPDQEVVSDVAFVQDENREILVVGASTDHAIVLVDLETMATTKLDLSPGSSSELPTGTTPRQLEWAVGTDYVWINGGDADEVYLVKIPGGISTAVLERTLTGVPSGQLLFVHNYERLRVAKLLEEAQTNAAAANVPATSGSRSSTTMGIVALVLGVLGFVAGSSALAVVVRRKPSDPPSEVLTPPASQPDVEETSEAPSLGSKRVS